MSSFEFAKMTPSSGNNDGLGPVDPNAARKRQQAVESWDAFRQIAKFQIGDFAVICSKRVHIQELRPITGGLVYVRGSGEGFQNGNYRPSDFLGPYQR